jgi:oxidoreductase
LKDVLKHGKYEKVVAIGRRPVELEESVPQDKLVRKAYMLEHRCSHSLTLGSKISRF